MNIPKNTEFTLKRIIENLDNIPNNGFGDKPQPMTVDQKKQLMEMAAMFESYGNFLNTEDTLMESAKKMGELCKLAHTYAIQECGDYFQTEIVNKDMKLMQQRVNEYQKLCKECYSKMQQLGVTYHDIRHVLGRYYKLQADVPDQNYKPVEK